MPDISVVENIVYRDRIAADVDEDDQSSLHFTHHNYSEKTLHSVNSDRYTDDDMIEDGQTDIDVDFNHMQLLYEHNIENPHYSDANHGAATTNENDLDGEVDTINGVDDDKQSVTVTRESS